MTGLFDRLKDDDSEGSEIVEERPVYEDKEAETIQSESEDDRVEANSDGEYRSGSNEVQEHNDQISSTASSDIGISSLMDKRAKLEEAIDYVGMMISNLKEKRTGLEKEIEEESVDIKNLKEKLMKVNDYIDEETQGIQNLTNKRSAVEREADEVGGLITTLRDKLAGIDQVVDNEGNRIKSFKESRTKTSNL
jgi:chromosome segregation ATPase